MQIILIYYLKRGIKMIRFLKVMCTLLLVIASLFAMFDKELLTIKDNTNLDGVTQVIRIRDNENDSIKRVYKTIKNRYPDKLIQLVNVKGYNSDVKVMVIMDIAERTVDEVKVLSHSETSGLGDRITYDSFLGQFKKFETDDVVYVSTNGYCLTNEVRVVANATISSKAVVTAVNKCINNFNKMI